MCRNRPEKRVSFGEKRKCLIAVTSASPKTVVKAISLANIISKCDVQI